MMAKIRKEVSTIDLIYKCSNLIFFFSLAFDLNRHFIENQLEMKGFNVWKLSGKRWMASIDENVKLLQDGKLKCFETIVEGFEKAPEALVHVLRGQYKGRVVVKV